MINAFYTAKSGALGFQSSLGITSNNIANVNTAGYKGQKANFTELLYTNIQGPEGEAGVPRSGSGSRIQEAARQFSQGGMESTGRLLDAAIQGEGFFAVGDAQGNITFTRAGNFSLSSENGTNYLVTQNGDYVLDGNFQRIAVTGTDLSGLTGGGAESIGVFNFANPYALISLGDGRYAANPATGTAQSNPDAVIKTATLERSNVNLVDEFEKLIEGQRGFQLAARALQTADEMEQTANTLR